MTNQTICFNERNSENQPLDWELVDEGEEPGKRYNYTYPATPRNLKLLELLIKIPRTPIDITLTIPEGTNSAKQWVEETFHLFVSDECEESEDGMSEYCGDDEYGDLYYNSDLRSWCGNVQNPDDVGEWDIWFDPFHYASGWESMFFELLQHCSSIVVDGIKMGE